MADESIADLSGNAIRPFPWAWFTALIGWTALLSFYGLEGGAGFEPTDCWVAQTAREMRESGRWLVPRFSGETRLQKSPGPYWAVMLASAARGTPIDEASARIPNALAAVALVAVVFLLARAIAGDRAAVFAGFSAASSVMILYWSHRGASDLGLAAWIAISLACFWAGANERTSPRRRHAFWMAAYLAAGLGMLYKMPMPLVCVGFPAFLYVLARRRWALLWDRWHVVGAALFLLPWLPWAAAVYWTEPTAVDKWRAEYLDRFTGNLPSVEDQRVWYFYFLYLLPLFFYSFPYSLSVLPAFVRGLRARSEVNRDGVVFLLVWFFGLLAFFTAATGKEVRYFLPAMPPVFVLLGMELAAFFDPGRPVSRRAARLGSLAVWVLVPAGLIAGAFAFRSQLRADGVFEWPAAWPSYAATAVVFAGGCSLAAWLFVSGRRNGSFAALVGTMWAFWLVAWPRLMPVLAHETTYIDFAEQLRHRLPAEHRSRLRHVGFQEARVIWYGDLRIPRVIDQLELLRMQGGRRSAAAEARLIAEEMVRGLLSDELTLFVARRPEYVRFLIEAGEEMARQGRPFPKTYLWLQTQKGRRGDRHMILFGNRPPPWPEPALEPPSQRLEDFLRQRAVAAPASNPTTRPAGPS